MIADGIEKLKDLRVAVGGLFIVAAVNGRVSEARIGGEGGRDQGEAPGVAEGRLPNDSEDGATIGGRHGGRGRDKRCEHEHDVATIVQSPLDRMGAMLHKVVCALDTSDLAAAEKTVRRLAGKVGAFKVGHALTLNHGLDVIDRLQDAGASRIFLDLKFHDIPNSVALAVREAAKRRVWMMTVHVTGGTAMLQAAMAEACSHAVGECPLIVGVGVLTSIDDEMLRGELGVSRSMEEQLTALSELAERCELDGMVCSPQEVAAVRRVLGHERAIVVPGIRVGGATHDQKRTGDPASAIAAGANYLVVGRALAEAPDPEEALAAFANL